MANNDQLLLGSIWNNKKLPKCCPNDFLTIVTQDSPSISFSGAGTVQDPLTAVSIGGGGGISDAENGLGILPSGNVGLGGEMTEINTFIQLNGNKLSINGETTGGGQTLTVFDPGYFFFIKEDNITNYSTSLSMGTNGLETGIRADYTDIPTSTSVSIRFNTELISGNTAATLSFIVGADAVQLTTDTGASAPLLRMNQVLLQLPMFNGAPPAGSLTSIGGAVYYDNSDSKFKIFSGPGVWMNVVLENPPAVGGISFPSYTTTERDTLVGLPGTVIYNSTTNKINFYNGTAWEQVTSA